MAAQPGTNVVALFDFAGESSEDLPFKRNEPLTIVKVASDSNWWLARNSKGKTGMIPANYVRPVGASDANQPADDAQGPMPWFHGKINRTVAEELIAGKPVGTFLVRESTNFPGDYTLTVVGTEAVDHYHIQSKGGKITIDDEVSFGSLDELISHYTQDADGLSTQLIRPLVRAADGTRVDEASIAQHVIEPKDLIKGAKLGSGQFGDVFEGTYCGQRVAIKTLKNYEQSLRDEFLAEASVMTKLKHPNLVKLEGVVTEGKEIMLVTEYMAKGNLLDFLRSRGRSVVKKDLLFKFTQDICEGMAFLEKQNVVHRDLAARNVLISEEDVAKVADFGLAKRSDWGDIDSGKLPIKWTAPEVLKHKVSTSKSDVWSFGITMWEIYSYGRSPYPRMSQKDVVDALPKGYRMERPDDCPETLYTAVMRACWEMDPLSRPTFNRLKRTLAKFKGS
ncbi:uncharacterized protein MONBRDRAFT_33686 [Monosiga brevicollis MX1]|uniref:non-specific protein-tyrosine kinase n=1 Tax=Monosiga brevicollis TaxID=81824 RepID=A9V6V0_MONBE|nr:uncharacterized protein MONBRDRAFT_33686 [Monosiga brevicollis MX1]EDQ86681.1 predicted protein [Monosiga brevicollis MX1]|eukprot:XP_001748517.1 hypothetical protein [Monosiga brevicollis MX1]